MDVHVIDTAELGDRSYVVAEDGTAVVVDPQRDIDRIEQLLAEHQLTCAMVVETHIHNDYVTGGYQLAQRSGARYVVNGDDPVSFDRTPVRDGDELSVGPLTVQAMATPGHTYTHLAYVITGSDGRPAVFTGGSLLYGSVGRTDLIDDDSTEDLTRHQFHSAHRLADTLADDVPVYPTHGFGSFCSSGSAAGGESSTIGEERRRNDALTADTEDGFVKTLIANLTAYPAYYAHMAGHNLAGPGPVDLTPPAPVDPHQLQHRLDHGDWVIDLRDRSAYAAGHLVGTLNIALGPQFSTYLGWLIPWGDDLTLIAESADHITDAQRQLTRIGIDQLAGSATGPLDELADRDEVQDYPEVGFDDEAFTAGSALLDTDQTGQVVLDVRREDERAHGAIPGSVHIPLHQLLNRLDDLPADTQLWVHCASGFRASIAASILARAGRDVVYINDDYTHAVEAGLATG